MEFKENKLEYNKNYIKKNVGYFVNYIYGYVDYLKNKNVLEPSIITNKVGIIYMCYKKSGLEENLTGILYFDAYVYNELIESIDKCIQLKINQLDEKEIKGLLIVLKIWEFKAISKYREKVAAQKVFDKKLIRFQKVIDKLVDYKVRVGAGLQEVSKFLADKILTKELKPYLHIKIIEELKQTECLSHLLNLILKRWKGVDAITFKYYMHKTIKLYQDNYEHGDVW